MTTTPAYIIEVAPRNDPHSLFYVRDERGEVVGSFPTLGGARGCYPTAPVPSPDDVFRLMRDAGYSVRDCGIVAYGSAWLRREAADLAARLPTSPTSMPSTPATDPRPSKPATPLERNDNATI